MPTPIVPTPHVFAPTRPIASASRRLSRHAHRRHAGLFVHCMTQDSSMKRSSRMLVLFAMFAGTRAVGESSYSYSYSYGGGCVDDATFVDAWNYGCAECAAFSRTRAET